MRKYQRVICRIGSFLGLGLLLGLGVLRGEDETIDVAALVKRSHETL